MSTTGQNPILPRVEAAVVALDTLEALDIRLKVARALVTQEARDIRLKVAREAKVSETNFYFLYPPQMLCFFIHSCVAHL